MPVIRTHPEQQLSHHRSERYDDLALVVIDVGADGAPGQAGVDDAGNGVTDDRDELGATKSDDLCHVVFGADAKRTTFDTNNNPRLTLVKGAFRPIQPGEGLQNEENVRRFFLATTPGGLVVEWMSEGMTTNEDSSFDF